MLKRSVLTLAALAVSAGVFAQDVMGPLDPQYKAPAYSDIHKGDGAMTQQEYMDYVGRSWKGMGGKSIDKSNARYSDYQKSSRFEMMDTNHDGMISEEEYRSFYEGAWKGANAQSMMQQDYDKWIQNKDNPLNPTFKKN